MEYRAVFAPLHQGSDAYSEAGMDCVTYEAQAAKRGSAELMSLQTFVDTTGLTRYQATWKTY